MTVRTILWTGLFAALTAGCAHWQPSGQEHDKADEPVVAAWPPAPELARIRYLQSIASERDIGVQLGLFQRFMRFLTGEQARSLVRPSALSVDAENRLYVVDTHYRRVHVFDRAEGVHYVFPETPPEGFVNPVGVTAGTNGRVYVSDSEARVIHVFSSHGKRYEGRIGEGLFERPTGLAFDAESGHLLVTDTVAGTLTAFEEWPLEPGQRRKAAVKAELEPAAVWRGAGSDRMHGPTHVAVNAGGGVVVTDSLNFRVQKLDRSFAPVGAFGEAGDQPGYFSRPKGVAVDSVGNIYVVDALFGNVQIFNTQGDLLLTFGKPGAGIGEFWLASGICIDKQDRIYVADAWNQRVQVFQYLHREEYPR